MKKLTIFLMLNLLINALMAQIPEGINYQAIARNGAGNPIENALLQVRLSILSDTTGFKASGAGIYIWEEQHAVTTNSQGLFNLVVGDPKAVKVQGSATGFASIDWEQGPLFLGIKIQPPSSTWRILGASGLWTVPYSMMSKQIAEGSKLKIVSNDDESAEPLFEVKRKDGQTVFAVYNDAVHVYVPDQETKKARGGFAVGGYDQTKGFSQHYMTVTPDSIRFYIGDNPEGKGQRGGFAVGGFDAAKAQGEKYLSLYGSSTIDTLTNASQILWYPRKEAFLAGKIDILHPDSVGVNSFSMGYKNQAIGDFSQALGYRSVARGNYSTAIGRSAIAWDNSFALGNMSQARGNDSYAMGSGSVALGATSVALGVTSRSEGFGSIAFGVSARSLKLGSLSLGLNTAAEGEQSLAMGFEAKATGDKSIAIGSHYNVTFNRPVWEWSAALNRYVINYVPTTIDKLTIAEGVHSIAIGNGNHSNNGGITLGINNDATAYGSVALGHSNQVASEFSFTAGYNNYLNGLGTFALGNNLIAKSANSFVIGAFNLEEGTVNEWIPKDPLFVIGNGNPTLRSNAFTVLKDGNIVLSNNIAEGPGIPLVYDPVDHMLKINTSSIRYKTDINSLSAVEWLYDLNPVTFRYNTDKEDRLQYGLLAEEMEEVNSDLVLYRNGVPDGINYNSLFAPMIKALQVQKGTIEELTRENTELRLRLTELENRLNALANTLR
jgi:hypothetical protein